LMVLEIEYILYIAGYTNQINYIYYASPSDHHKRLDMKNKKFT